MMIQNRAANISAAAITCGVSLLRIASIANVSTPGMANTDSVITEPLNSVPKCIPAIVMTGKSAFLRACFHMTTMLVAPFAFAVRI